MTDLNNLIKALIKSGGVFKVKVRPGASKNKIKDLLDQETIKIDIAAQPEKGKANKELIKFLAQSWNLDKENFKIISGAGDRIKLIRLIK